MRKLSHEFAKEEIERAFAEYDKHGQETRRFTRLNIDLLVRPSDTWQLWLLAIAYQGKKEIKCEESFLSLKKNNLCRNPSKILLLAQACGCPLLSNYQSVHFCNYLKKYPDKCKYENYISKCPIRSIVKEEIKDRYAKIAFPVVSSAIFLRDYDFDIRKYYQTLEKSSCEDRTHDMLATFTILAHSDKLAHLFLGWLSNPRYPWSHDWQLDYRKFIAVDTNIKKILKSRYLCHSDRNEVARACLYQLERRFKLNPKVIELGLLHMGQKIKHKHTSKKSQY
ncbi:MAG: hypothetical protein H3Z54_04775 [archaeon]|nr:hypothetical protein [archaeon]